MATGTGRMSIMDHIGELRRRITIIVISLVIAAIVLYFATPTIINILIRPIKQFLPDSNLAIMSSLGGFTIRFKVALFIATIVCSPIIIWEVMGFFIPALKPKERKWVVPTVAVLVALYYLGMLFCYFVIQQAAFGWMIAQSSAFATVIPNADDYLTIMMLLEIGFGVAFEIPLVIFYLSVFHLVPYKTFRENWRFIYIGLLVFSAMVTPDASPVTMFLMFAAIILLYEISLGVARSYLIRRYGRESLKWDRDQFDTHESQDNLVKKDVLDNE